MTPRLTFTLIWVLFNFGAAIFSSVILWRDIKTARDALRSDNSAIRRIVLLRPLRWHVFRFSGGLLFAALGIATLASPSSDAPLTPTFLFFALAFIGIALYSFVDAAWDLSDEFTMQDELRKQHKESSQGEYKHAEH